MFVGCNSSLRYMYVCVYIYTYIYGGFCYLHNERKKISHQLSFGTHLATTVTDCGRESIILLTPSTPSRLRPHVHGVVAAEASTGREVGRASEPWTKQGATQTRRGGLPAAVSLCTQADPGSYDQAPGRALCQACEQVYMSTGLPEAFSNLDFFARAHQDTRK